MRDFFNAVRFLTVLPVPTSTEHRPDDLPRAMFFFPAAGLLIAALSWGLYAISESFFPAHVSVLVLLIAPVLISGGLHVDGFADFCDGFFGGKEKADILRIMKDSRVGAWGALGIALLMIVKLELLKALPSREAVFFIAMAFSRWAQVVLSFFLPYAGSGGGMGEQVAKKTGLRELCGASIFLILPGIFLPVTGLIVLAALAVALFFLGLFFKRRLGGMTGDLYGAASELTEIFVFLIATGLAYHEF